jgi:hypothetical protein
MPRVNPFPLAIGSGRLADFGLPFGDGKPLPHLTISSSSPAVLAVRDRLDASQDKFNKKIDLSL